MTAYQKRAELPHKISVAHQQMAEKLAAAFIAEEVFAAGTPSFSEDDAFSIKRAMFRALKATLPQQKPESKIIGRKIGRNDRVGLIATPIYQQGVKTDQYLPNNLIGLEPELAVVWGDDLPSRIKNEKDFTRALRDAGAKLVMGIEILANRFAVPPLPWNETNRPDFSLILADHLHQWGYIVGDELHDIDSDGDYHKQPFSFRCGARNITAAGATLPFGNPLNILWQFYQTRPFNPLTATEHFNRGEVITLGCLLGTAVPFTKADATQFFTDNSDNSQPAISFSFAGFKPLNVVLRRA
ncbi:MAG: hypothetical protein QM529_02355 [Hydrotalea sp.]|nr:hypothetical protein [Hydrotalea sp.]